MELIKVKGLDRLSVVHKMDSRIFCVVTDGHYNEISNIYELSSSNILREISRDTFLQMMIGDYYQKIQDHFTTELEHFSIQRDLGGNLYIHFYQEWDMYNFDDKGNLLKKINLDFSEGHTCYDIKIEPPHHLWLTFPTGNTVVKLNLNTLLITKIYGDFSWQDTDTKDNKFLAYPESLWVDNGTVYIPNMGNGKLFAVNAQNSELNLKHTFKDELWNYFILSNREYVKLQSGTFMILN